MCSAPLFTSMPPSLLLLHAAAAIPPFLSSPSLSLLHCPPAGSMQATHTHSLTHTHSKYGCVLPSTDARRITVREITVNICSMNMMRLAERGEEDNLLCHLSLYGCLSYITPSLSLYLPAHLSLTHFHHLSFSVLPSFPPTLCLSIFSHSHAQLNSPPSFSLFLSHSSHLSLVSPFLPLHSGCQASFVSFEALNSSFILSLLLFFMHLPLQDLNRFSTKNHPVAFT